MNKSVLIVDENLAVCIMLKSWLAKQGYQVETVSSTSDAKKKVKSHPFDLILLDVSTPNVDGLTFLSWLKRYDSDIIVIMIPTSADVESAVSSMKTGAADYLPKPFEADSLFRKIEEAFQMQELKQRKIRFANDFILPPGEEYQILLNQIDDIAENKRHQLVIGERGTGKVSTVRYIYEKSGYLNGPLVMLDTDQLNDRKYVNWQHSEAEKIPSLLMEKFNDAEGGLLHIRKVDQLDVNLQNELLNLLTKQSKDDFYTQIIMTTEKNKEELEKLLIPKLFNLLIEESIALPTLKGKKEVIDSFVIHFLHFANHNLDKQIQSIDKVIYQLMYDYAWPGNIQELKNSILQAALLTEGRHMPATIYPRMFGKNSWKQGVLISIPNPVQNLRKENYEKEKILEALRLAKGNKTMAASILNIDRKTLYNKLKLYNVNT
jgi:two-component system response regulator HydG